MSTRWQKISPLARIGTMRADPYFEWAVRTGFAYHGGSEWVPVLIELRRSEGFAGTALAFAKLVAKQQRLGRLQPNVFYQVRLPRSYADPPLRLKGKPLHFVSGLMTRKLLQATYLGGGLERYIASFEIGRATPPSTEVTALAPPPAALPSPPRAVLFGVIDDGIAFAHERFLGADGTTRIEALWDQRVPSAVWGDWAYGRQTTKRDPADGIDHHMKASRHGLLVDEDEVYRHSGHTDPARPGPQPLARRFAHGTHVLDLAAGSAAPPAAGMRPIVAVQLPAATVEDTSGATLAPQVYNGLRYVIEQADAIPSASPGAPPLPIVVNVSYGMRAGPHDGSSHLERAIDELVATCNHSLAVTLPAGNDFHARCHAHFDLAPGASVELPWRVQPDDQTESHLQLWLPADAQALHLTVVTPDAAAVSWTGWSSSHRLVDAAGATVGSVACQPPGALGPRALVQLSIAPTAAIGGGVALAPAGLWRIVVANPLGASAVGDMHAWVQRDDTAPGLRKRGRQSYFDDPHYQRFDDTGRLIDDDADPATADSIVRRGGTLNAIATGRRSIVVGGYRRSDGCVAAYSAAGPLAAPGRGAPSPHGPDALLPSDDSPAHAGLVAAGTRSRSCGAMHGTSVAAPLAARRIAEAMAAGRPHDRKALFAAAQADDTDPAKPAPIRGGGGRLGWPARWPPRIDTP